MGERLRAAHSRHHLWEAEEQPNQQRWGQMSAASVAAGECGAGAASGSPDPALGKGEQQLCLQTYGCPGVSRTNSCTNTTTAGMGRRERAEGSGQGCSPHNMLQCKTQREASRVQWGCPTRDNTGQMSRAPCFWHRGTPWRDAHRNNPGKQCGCSPRHCKWELLPSPHPHHTKPFPAQPAPFIPEKLSEQRTQTHQER